MIVQLQLTTEYKKIISEFLVIQNESITMYNNRLSKLKSDLRKIQNHHVFTEELKPLEYPPKKKRLIYATAQYKRVRTWQDIFIRDVNIRKPVPDIFEKPLNLLYTSDYLIGRFDYFYNIKKKEGYNFPTEIIDKKIKFKLIRVYIDKGKDTEYMLTSEMYFKKYSFNCKDVQEIRCPNSSRITKAYTFIRKACFGSRKI